MKHLAEYRNPATAKQLTGHIAALVTRPWTLMEICGGQTHSIMKYGLDRLLPEQVELIHGPGCPVCVTPLECIDKAIAIAQRPEAILCSFGDMLRVPGSGRDLLSVKAAGGDVRAVYSPLDAVKIARENPQRQVVFFAVGFETTAPAAAMAAFQAKQAGLANFSLLVSHVRVPPAMEALLDAPDNRVQGFLAAGHVCTVMGYTEYEPLARRYKIPIVVTGFEPVDILGGIHRCLKQLEEGRHEVENEYRRSVRREGNQPAQALLAQVFRVIDRPWRGLGVIPASGLGLSPEYAGFDAENRFELGTVSAPEPAECRSGLVLQGALKPDRCPAFGTRCTPEHPLGATMVSSEGACAAYYRYRHAAHA
ncbi:hydrogenase expression/formation protein HypD [Methylomagnum ishizawai]|uniref:Hydrogenase maturation factor n=1 Tax=Methylomagnum ishizawai TaxID=1760988 RepID=A0A1Y6CXY4_9GAMM|nr:hydrogenase formation protein HypD [Methylomagnum ishizawai]SMF93423.1 hydrogenase expression/formation protein HypD [Methylomagnum ishizawai]